MKQFRHERGMTLIGFLLVLAIACFFAFIGLKLFPLYQEYFSVRQAMASVAAQPGIANKSPQQIRSILSGKFLASYVEVVKPKDAKIVRKNGYRMTMKWEDRIEFLGNIDLVAKFENTVELTNR